MLFLFDFIVCLVFVVGTCDIFQRGRAINYMNWYSPEAFLFLNDFLFSLCGLFDPFFYLVVRNVPSNNASHLKRSNCSSFSTSIHYHPILTLFLIIFFKGKLGSRGLDSYQTREPVSATEKTSSSHPARISAHPEGGNPRD